MKDTIILISNFLWPTSLQRKDTRSSPIVSNHESPTYDGKQLVQGLKRREKQPQTFKGSREIEKTYLVNIWVIDLCQESHLLTKFNVWASNDDESSSFYISCLLLSSFLVYWRWRMLSNHVWRPRHVLKTNEKNWLWTYSLTPNLFWQWYWRQVHDNSSLRPIQLDKEEKGWTPKSKTENFTKIICLPPNHP